MTQFRKQHSDSMIVFKPKQTKTQLNDLATNRPCLSTLVPLFQNESKCETFHMKMSFACSLIFMQIKVIFIRIVSHLGLPHTSQFFCRRTADFLSGSNRVKMCRDISLAHNCRFFVATNRVWAWGLVYLRHVGKDACSRDRQFFIG